MQANQNNLIGMRDAILAWGQHLFAETPPTTLKQLTQLLGDAELQQQFALLDRQLYNGETGDVLDIPLLLERLKKQSNFSHGSRANSGTGLKPLYPDH
jgi:hypothetical protein